MSNSLYVLSEQFAKTVDQLELLDLDPEVFQDTLDSVQAPLQEKAENVVKYMRSLEALATSKKIEANRLAESAANDLKRVEWLKNYLADSLSKAGINKMQAGIFDLGFRKGSEVVEIDESILEEDCWVEQEPKPMSKSDLKKLLKAGRVIEGATLVRKPDTLTIK